MAIAANNNPEALTALASEGRGPAGAAERTAVGRTRAPETALEEELAADRRRIRHRGHGSGCGGGLATVCELGMSTGLCLEHHGLLLAVR
jgi:hypothetical protein